MPDREFLTSERLDEAWMVLWDLSEQDGSKVSEDDLGVLEKARHIVERFQHYFRGTRGPARGGEKAFQEDIE